MNLYRVCTSDYEWCCFVFDITRGRAKAKVANEFDCEYIDMRCQTMRKGVNVPFPAVVSSPDDKEYEWVTKCGCRYMTEEEREEWERMFDI